ncbi:MAG TPA: hypothetical protein VK009_27940 [Chloroflexota bacterium]|nr:hypothetical protein [Chloroflexota bacterium]
MVEYGWLDTALFIHLLFQNDRLRPRCREIVHQLETDEATGWFDVLVIHELTYSLPRTKLPQFATRQGIADYIRGFVELDSVQAESKDELLEGLELWAQGRVSFTDARLAVLARQRGMVLCSPNEKDFEAELNTFPG